MTLISKLIFNNKRHYSLDYWSPFGRVLLANYVYNNTNDNNRYMDDNRKQYSWAKLSAIRGETEKLIDRRLSDFRVRHLLRDELDLKVFTINKVNTKYISDSNHPIVDIARDMFADSHDSGVDSDSLRESTGSLLLLLMAKVSQSLPSFTITTCEDRDVIVRKQSDMTEIYAMINKALYIHHAAVVNIPVLSENIEGMEDRKRMNDANKISILGGDYLLSYSIVRLANLVNNNAVLRLIMCAIEDYCVYHFCNENRDGNSSLLIPTPGTSLLDWEETSGYSVTRLLAYCSQIMLLLAKQSDRYQKAAFDLGYYSQLLWNLKDEMDIFREVETDRPLAGKQALRLMSAPIILHMQSDPTFYGYLKGASDRHELDTQKIKQMILNGPAFDKCDRYLDLYTNKALKSLDIFPDCTAKTILKDAIIA